MQRNIEHKLEIHPLMHSHTSLKGCWLWRVYTLQFIRCRNIYKCLWACCWSTVSNAYHAHKVIKQMCYVHKFISSRFSPTRLHICQMSWAQTMSILWLINVVPTLLAIASFASSWLPSSLSSRHVIARVIACCWKELP